ncbi:MAG: FmdB family transcriptional regulator [Chloroflexota bacterium]|nr:FmdB family transcriptional regulator [Chloroflexota bacterium]
MPIYDYRCDACGHAFSAVQSYQDETLDTCPQCSARPRKLMSSPAIVFKGSGWYKTDSRRGSSDAKADAKAEGKSEGTSEGKADKKPDGKPETSTPKPAAAEAKAEKPAEGKKEPAS